MNEFQIFQNRLISAHLIWEFSKFYEDHNLRKEQPTLMTILPVLPICLNARSARAIKDRRYKEGSLLKVIEEQRDLFAGLQERMESMFSLTMESIYMASVSDLVLFDADNFLVIPKRPNLPERISKNLNKDYVDLLHVSRRLGAWFSNMNISEISLHFNITF